MAEEETETPVEAPPRASPMGFILALLALTVIAAAGGGAFAVMQVDSIAAVAKQRANAEPDKAENALAWDVDSALAKLDPVLTNLAAPTSVWVRLEGAVVFDKDAVSDVERLRAQVNQDILAFLRTVTLGELTGASALAHLRDDLNERIRLTTSDAVQELIIQSMVLQ